MYESFFGLVRRPFAATPDPNCWVAVETIEKALDELIRNLEFGQGIGVLTAPAGLGKTLLCRKLSMSIREMYATVYLANSNFPTPRALLQAILYELGHAYISLDEPELRLELKTAVKAVRPDRKAVVLVVDEAHLLSEEVLEEIRTLTNFVEDDSALVRVVLVGQLSLEETLASPTSSALNQRITCHTMLEPLTREESIEYVDARVRWSANGVAEFFTPEAIQMIAYASDGVPRCLNQLCDHCLLLSYVSETKIVGPETVRDALDDLKQLPLQWSDPPALPTTMHAGETQEGFIPPTSVADEGAPDCTVENGADLDGAALPADRPPVAAREEAPVFEVGFGEVVEGDGIEDEPKSSVIELGATETFPDGASLSEDSACGSDSTNCWDSDVNIADLSEPAELPDANCEDHQPIGTEHSGMEFLMSQTDVWSEGPAWDDYGYRGYEAEREPQEVPLGIPDGDGWSYPVDEPTSAETDCEVSPHEQLSTTPAEVDEAGTGWDTMVDPVGKPNFPEESHPLCQPSEMGERTTGVEADAEGSDTVWAAHCPPGFEEIVIVDRYSIIDAGLPLPVALQPDSTGVGAAMNLPPAAPTSPSLLVSPTILESPPLAGHHPDGGGVPELLTGDVYIPTGSPGSRTEEIIDNILPLLDNVLDPSSYADDNQAEWSRLPTEVEPQSLHPSGPATGAPAEEARPSSAAPMLAPGLDISTTEFDEQSQLIDSNGENFGADIEEQIGAIVLDTCLEIRGVVANSTGEQEQPMLPPELQSSAADGPIVEQETQSHPSEYDIVEPLDDPGADAATAGESAPSTEGEAHGSADHARRLDRLFSELRRRRQQCP